MPFCSERGLLDGKFKGEKRRFRIFSDGYGKGAFRSGAGEGKVRAQARVGTMYSRAASLCEHVTLAGVTASESSEEGDSWFRITVRIVGVPSLLVSLKDHVVAGG